MSNLSGYDSEAIGFDSVSQTKREETSSSTQTTFKESGVSCQTNLTSECGSTATREDINADNIIYDPPALNAFLRKVVPGLLEQLGQNRDVCNNSSDSDEEDAVPATLVQEIEANKDLMSLGSGDHKTSSILSVSWSSAGNSLAVSIGQSQHERWCEHEGFIRVYTVKRTAGDKLVHSLDISEKNCVTVVKYHPSLAALLAYGTTAGEVVFCDLRDSNSFTEGMQLTSPPDCHGGRSISSLYWADPSLSNRFLTLQIKNTGKRRGAADQILISSGADGTMNVWQVNANMKIFENVITFTINGSKKMDASDISCFDFAKNIASNDATILDDVFVVATKTGNMFLCKINADQYLADGDIFDPVYQSLVGHATCVLNVAFSFQRQGVFASVSIDSEVRVYDINQCSPLQVVCIDYPVSCMSWLPNSPGILILGFANADKKLVRLYNACSGREVPVEGLSGAGTVTSIAVTQSNSCRIAAGDSGNIVRIWELPVRRIRLSSEDIDF